MKPTKIKAWPELLGFQPCLISIRDAPEKTSRAIEIDFGSVREVSSTGLTVFLLRVLAALGGVPPVQIYKDCPTPVRNKLEALGAFMLLQRICGPIQQNLDFGTSENMIVRDACTESTSIPIYHLHFVRSISRRRSVHAFKMWLMHQLTPVLAGFNTKPHALVQLIGEIAKNTADHTLSEGLFGMDITQIAPNHFKLTFAFGDLGEGIKRNVQAHLQTELSKRMPHLSLYEIYRIALTPGFSSKGEAGKNKGHGMTIIIDCANDLGVNLSIFDAASRGLLSDLGRIAKPSHAAVRRIFHSVGHDVGFIYYGELHLTRS